MAVRLLSAIALAHRVARSDVARADGVRRSDGRRSRKTASISMRTAIRPSRSAPTARSTGTPFGLSPVPLRMPCLPRPGRRGIDLRAGAGEFAEDDELRRLPGVVASGRKNVSASQENVMPAFGDNPNVLLHGRSLRLSARPRERRVPRGRPAKREEKPRGLYQGREDLRGYELSKGSAAGEASAGIGCRPLVRAAPAAVRRRARRRRAGLGAARSNWSIPNVLRVCADPHNMPFSDEKGEGFENKLAELFAEKLGEASPTPVSRRRPASCGYARRAIVRRHHGLPAGRRSGAEHQRLLSHRLCAGLQAGRVSMVSTDRGSSAEAEAHRRRRGHAARPTIGEARAARQSKALSR